MKEVIDFFRRLHDNNDRAWFDAHRTEWAHVKGYFAAFTEQLIAGIAEFDPTVRGLRVQDCTYRIARDTRFSPDKSPYKTYIGAYIAPKGKKSGFAGYYFHIEPCCDSLVWSNLLSAGLYCPEPVVLRSVREEILDNGAEIAAAIRKAKGFAIVEETHSAFLSARHCADDHQDRRCAARVFHHPRRQGGCDGDRSEHQELADQAPW